MAETRTLAQLGPILALQFSPCGTYLFAGQGESLSVFHVQTGRMLLSYIFFPAGRIHGIAFYPTLSPIASPGSSSQHQLEDRSKIIPSSFLQFAVWGQTRLITFQLDISSLHSFVTASSSSSSSPLPPIPTLFQNLHHFQSRDWIIQCYFFSSPHISSSGPLLALCLAHGTIEIRSLPSDSALFPLAFTMKCPNSRGILYAASFLFHLDRLWCAVSTMSSTFQLFSIPFVSKSEQEDVIVLKGEGHKGTVFGLYFSACGDYITSCSDDRTVLLWVLNHSSHTLTATHVCFGHVSRVWQAHFLSDKNLLVSCSEDNSIRVWKTPAVSPLSSSSSSSSSSAPTQCLSVARFDGHSGKSVWKIALQPPHSLLLASGGNDSAIKLWDLQSIIQREVSSSASSPVAASDLLSIQLTIPEDGSAKRSEFIRCVKLNPSSLSSAVVLTNRGFVFSVDFKSSASTVLYRHTSSFFLSLAISPCGTVSVCGDGAGNLLVFTSSTSPSTPLIVPTTLSRIQSLQFLPNGYLCALGTDPRALLLSYSITPSSSSSAAAATVELTPVSYFHISGSVDKAARLVCVDFDPISSTILFGDTRGNLHIATAAQQHSLSSSSSIELKPVVRVHKTEYVNGVHISAGGHSGFSIGGDGSLSALSAAAAAPMQVSSRVRVGGNIAYPEFMFMSADETEVAMVAGIKDGNVILWDRIRHRQMFSVRVGGYKALQDIVVSSSSDRYGLIFAAHNEKTTVVVHLDPETKKSIFDVPQSGSEGEGEASSSSSSSSPSVAIERVSLHTEFHGREVYDIALISESLPSSSVSSASSSPYGSILFATASEDTTVKLLEYIPSTKSLVCFCTLRGHSSAVRSLSVLPLPSSSSSSPSAAEYLLISGGGRCGLFIWKLQITSSASYAQSRIQHQLMFGGALDTLILPEFNDLEPEGRRAYRRRPDFKVIEVESKEEEEEGQDEDEAEAEDSESDEEEEDEDNEELSHSELRQRRKWVKTTTDWRIMDLTSWHSETDFVIASADSDGKIRIYSMSASGAVTAVKTLLFHPGAVLSVASLPPKSLFCSGGTEGQIALWHYTASTTSPLLVLSDMNGNTRIHQNGINAIDMLQVTSSSSSLDHILVASCGDDQSITISLVQVSSQEAETPLASVVAFFSIPNAQGASITDVSLHMDSNGVVQLICAGVDQRINTYQVIIECGGEAAAAVRLDLTQSRMHSTPDISCMLIAPQANVLAVSGIGLQLVPLE